jgi:hypothetical protein
MAKRLSKSDKMELRKKISLSRARTAAKRAAAAQQHTLTSGGAGFGLGFAESRGFKMPTIGKVDPVALYSVAAFIASLYIKNPQIKRIAEGLTDGLVSVGLYKAGKFGFESLMNYAPAASGYGEDIVETGVF